MAAKKVVLDFLRSVQESAMNNMTTPSEALSIDNTEPERENSETSDAQEEADLWTAHDS